MKTTITLILAALVAALYPASAHASLAQQGPGAPANEPLVVSTRPANGFDEISQFHTEAPDAAAKDIRALFGGTVNPTDNGARPALALQGAHQEVGGSISIAPIFTSVPSQSYFFLDTGEGSGSAISVTSLSSSPQSMAFQPITPQGNTPSAVPIPPAFLLMGSGLAGMAGLRRVCR